MILLRSLEYAGCLFLLFAGAASADAGSVRTFLRTILVARDASQLPGADDSRWEVVDASLLTPDEAREVLPLADDGLKSGLPRVRAYSLGLIFSVATRPDSASLVDAYVDDIAPFLSDPELGYRRQAIFILGNENPHPSRKATATLAAHLADQGNTAWETGMIAGALLASAPSDASIVSSVLSLASQRPDLKLGKDVIRQLGLFRVTTDDALVFIRSHFADPDASVRLTCVEAMAQMPQNIRNRFTAELQHVVGDPLESQRTRERASAVLAQQ